MSPTQAEIEAAAKARYERGPDIKEIPVTLPDGKPGKLLWPPSYFAWDELTQARRDELLNNSRLDLDAAARVRWQTMDTAPDDQQHILAIHIMNGEQRVSWRDEVNPSLYRYGGGEWVWQPTHWQPLPPAPESK